MIDAVNAATVILQSGLTAGARLRRLAVMAAGHLGNGGGPRDRSPSRRCSGFARDQELIRSRGVSVRTSLDDISELFKEHAVHLPGNGRQPNGKPDLYQLISALPAAIYTTDA